MQVLPILFDQLDEDHGLGLAFCMFDSGQVGVHQPFFP